MGNATLASFSGYATTCPGGNRQYLLHGKQQSQYCDDGVFDESRHR